MYSSPAIDPRPSVRFSTACKIDLDLSGFSFALTKYRIEKNVTSKAFDRKTEVTEGARFRSCLAPDDGLQKAVHVGRRRLQSHVFDEASCEDTDLFAHPQNGRHDVSQNFGTQLLGGSGPYPERGRLHCRL